MRALGEVRDAGAEEVRIGLELGGIDFSFPAGIQEFVPGDRAHRVYWHKYKEKLGA